MYAEVDQTISETLQILDDRTAPSRALKVIGIVDDRGYEAEMEGRAVGLRLTTHRLVKEDSRIMQPDRNQRAVDKTIVVSLAWSNPTLFTAMTYCTEFSMAVIQRVSREKPLIRRSMIGGLYFQVGFGRKSFICSGVEKCGGHENMIGRLTRNDN